MADQIEFFEHPDFVAHREKWETYRDLYEGDHAVLRTTRYLWPHQIESASHGGGDLRRIREMRSRYTNLIEPAISRWVSFTVSNDPKVDEELFAALGESVVQDDIDGHGRGLVTWIKDALLPAYFLYGKPLILVDADAADLETGTELERREKGLRVYLEVISPLDVKDWQVDKNGKYTLLRYEYEALEPRLSLTAKPEMRRYTRVYTLTPEGVVIERYRAESKEGQTKTTSKWILAEPPRLLAGWRELPVATIKPVDSYVKDAAEVVLRLFNHESSLDNQLNNQAFQRIIIGGRVPNEAKLAIGEHTVTFIEGDEVSVSVVEPSDTSPLEKRIAQDLDLFFKVAFNTLHSLPADSREAMSMAAQQESKGEFISLTKSAIGELEGLVNDALRYATRFMTGAEEAPGRVHFSSDITSENVDQQLRIWNAFRDEIVARRSWHTELLKKAARWQGMKGTEEIDAEIDAAPAPAAEPTEPGVPDLRSRLRAVVTGG